MEQKRYNYAVEKLTTTLKCLATHPGDVRKRLKAASLIFCVLREGDFPPEHRNEWRWVKNELTKFGPLLNDKGEIWQGSIENTMYRIRKKTGSKIAKKIYELYWVVSENQQYF
ncbi:MAG: hypothetical protein KAS69_00365 [Planctomycetes bacterium]|nr:hypothetical protein [Planctomycetota bacterium]